MSIETEDAYEEALQSDLPSPDTEARLRRRLLGAGIAVGNGIAATTAAASASSGVATTGAGVVAKLIGASWGVKLGLAAAITIPSVGLLLERRHDAVAVAPSSVVAPAPAPSSVVAPAPEVAPPATTAAAAPLESAAPLLVAPRAAKSPPTPEASPVPRAARPSQDAFASAPPTADVRAPQLATTLAEETRLLDRALSALGAGDRARAAELLAEHESRYPQGLLVKERERAKARLSELSRGE